MGSTTATCARFEPWACNKWLASNSRKVVGGAGASGLFCRAMGVNENQEQEQGAKLGKKTGATLTPHATVAESLRKRFGHEPTPGQARLFELMDKWLQEKNTEKPTFILRGYAGTGKTSFLDSLVKTLPKVHLQVQLMAPTGRASKVISGYTRRLALTIHKRIFKYEVDASGYPHMKRQRNSFSKTLFVVDEASMVGNQAEYGTKGVLEELIRYVFEGKENKLLFIGDTAQLPPVGTSLSPALHAEEMAVRFGLTVVQHELVDVVRQELDSGILANATALREKIRGVAESFAIHSAGYPDIFRIKNNKTQEGLEYAYQKYGMERSLVVTRTNRQATLYNKMIRHQLLYREEELEAGDWLIVVKNNYSVLDADSKHGFLANGDLAMVRRMFKTMEDYPLRLKTIEMQLADDDDAEPIECFAFADLLYSDLPQLTDEQLRNFHQVVMAEWQLDEPNQKKLWARLRTDPLANAVQIKFGYALTCHKGQGGQWDAVFIDHGFLKEGPLDVEFYRWLYTAITRARKEVYIIEPDARLLG